MIEQRVRLRLRVCPGVFFAFACAYACAAVPEPSYIPTYLPTYYPEVGRYLGRYGLSSSDQQVKEPKVAVT